MRFARGAGEIAIQAGFATKLLPPKSVPHKAKASVAHVAPAFANRLWRRSWKGHQLTAAVPDLVSQA
jgi:hypothetical protein